MLCTAEEKHVHDRSVIFRKLNVPLICMQIVVRRDCEAVVEICSSGRVISRDKQADFPGNKDL